MTSLSETKLPFGDSKNQYAKVLDFFQRRAETQDMDNFIVITGKERRGKSTKAAQDAFYMSKGKLKVEDICMDADEFLNRVRKSKKGDVIIFDEAGTNLFSREAVSRMNKMLIKVFMVSGLKNITIFLLIPNFFALDTYIRTHRIDLLVHVTSRGKFLAWSGKRAKTISVKGAAQKKFKVSANLRGWFTKQFPKDLEEDYRKKESKFKHKFIDESRSGRHGKLSITEIALQSGYSTASITRWIQNGMIKGERIGHKYYIDKSQLNVIKKHQDRGRVQKPYKTAKTSKR